MAAMNTPTKQELLQVADAKAIVKTLANCWPTLQDEEQQELCLEQIYELLETTAPYPPEFSMLSQGKKAQYEIDIDMALITITFKDIGALIFQDEEISDYFWGLVGNREEKKHQKMYKKLFD